MPVSWIDLLALAACRTGEGDGKTCGTGLSGFADRSEPSGAFGSCSNIIPNTTRPMMRPWGGGNYAILVEDDRGEDLESLLRAQAFSPIAAGYGHSHCDDFGVGRSYGLPGSIWAMT